MNANEQTDLAVRKIEIEARIKQLNQSIIMLGIVVFLLSLSLIGLIVVWIPLFVIIYAFTTKAKKVQELKEVEILMVKAASKRRK